MASRLTSRRASGMISDNEDDFKLDFLASQQSNGSDDHDQDFEIVLAKHYAALREKKKKENEQRFLKVAYNQLSKEVAAPAEDIKLSTKALEAIHEDFLQKYAANEDVIHKLWAQVLREHQKFGAFVKTKLENNIEAAKRAEINQISGLTRTQAACRELQEIIHQIWPEN